MPHLYLPTEHTDADLVLAADVAAAVSSSDLYVTWTIDSGAAAPEVAALVREEPVRPSRGGLFAAIAHALAVLWRSITGPPIGQVSQAHLQAPRAEEPTA